MLRRKKGEKAGGRRVDSSWRRKRDSWGRALH
jgi:hypothetical protein